MHMQSLVTISWLEHCACMSYFFLFTRFCSIVVPFVMCCFFVPCFHVCPELCLYCSMGQRTNRLLSCSSYQPCNAYCPKPYLAAHASFRSPWYHSATNLYFLTLVSVAHSLCASVQGFGACVRMFFRILDFSVLVLSLPRALCVCTYVFHFEMRSVHHLSHASSIYETIHLTFTGPATWNEKGTRVIRSSDSHTSLAISLNTVE